MRFVDEVEIVCVSGRGGDGARSFRREAHVPHGGPDGGDGGRGGDVVLVATRRLNTLEHLRGRRVYQAEKGQSGGIRNMHGRDGEAREVRVPIGTVLIDADEGIVLADLDIEDARAIVCRGGRGGKGNARFKSSTNRAPRHFEQGGVKVERRLQLELKLLADVGLLGFPNAGKSTLISTISKARPRVADYPFTTLVPNLGVASVGDESFVVADIPGLVQGASKGVGLGHQFLRHVERCSFLLHLVSCMEPGEAEPMERHRIIVEELKAFSPELAQRPQITVITKRDLMGEEELGEILDEFEAALGERPLLVSAVTTAGIPELLGLCAQKIRAMLPESDEA